MKENQYQKHLIDRVEDTFRGSIVIKNDPSYIQGFPDLLVLYNHCWAALEVKISDKAHVQPNQAYYVELLDHMSFASFVNPTNEEEVFRALQQAFRA